MTTIHYDDLEVPLSNPLLKMAIKRIWVGKDSNITRPLPVNANERLSPFLVMYLMEDKVASTNEDDDALTQELYVTLQNIKNLKQLITPEIRDIDDAFMLLLKRYENLNFYLFSNTRPLFWALVKII